MTTQSQHVSPSPLNLNKLPILPMQQIASYLDIGEIVTLTQVDRNLRYSLTDDNDCWVILLRKRLNIHLTGTRRTNAYAQLLLRLPTLRCANCHFMEFPRRPFFDPFWNRPLCDKCRMDDKYRCVTEYTAKRNYFLDNNDLLTLRTFSRENPHNSAGSHMRLYSRIDVQRHSQQKLQRLRTNRTDRLAKQHLRSEKAKERWRKQFVNRRRMIIQLLTANGFPSALSAFAHYCAAVEGFLRNGWRDWSNRQRWTAEDMLRICCPAHIP